MDRVTFFDGSNYMRRKYAEDLTMSGLRTCVRDVRTEIAKPNHQAIFVWDGFGANNYRKSFYPIYKEKREAGPDNFYEQVKVMQQILDHMPIAVFRLDGVEADDIIGVLAKHYVSNGAKVHVKSTDKDFEQLEGVTHEGTTLDLPPDQVIPYKVLVGDTSDNIKGVPNFGKKKWEAINKEHAARWVANDFNIKFMPAAMPVSIAKWCSENVDQLRILKRVCEFRELTDDQLKKAVKFGTNNPARVEEILKEYLA